MRPLKKLLLALLVCLAALALVIAIAHVRAKWALEAYKKQLVAAGEKLDYKQLIPPRSDSPNNAKTFLAAVRKARILHDIAPPAMSIVKPGHARATWQRPELVCSIDSSAISTNVWPELRRQIDEHQADLQELQKALDQPVLDFNLSYDQGLYMSMDHLMLIKQGQRELYALTLAELHDQRTDQAFEALCNAIKLQQVWSQEPVMISQLVRHACAAIAFSANWEALQFKGWSDSQLAQLQSQWESLDFLQPAQDALAMERTFLPWTIAQMRASYAAFNPPQPSDPEPPSALAHPGQALKRLAHRYPLYWKWCWIGSYSAEKQTMTAQQQAIELLRLAQKQQPFEIPDQNGQAQFPGDDTPALNNFVKRALRIQTQAQMMTAAIALQRYHLKTQAYPSSLDELVPSLLNRVPTDFMDRKPLRYARLDNGSFRLYSVGDDGTDSGGDPNSDQGSQAWLKGRDFVWPHLATIEEIQHFESQERR